MDTTAQDYRSHLDPKVLARISTLELRARLVVEGFFSGMHHSPHHGASVEFAEHRAYVQGDDLRHIDWKVYAKTDKHYIKEYEKETNLELLLLVDASDSMNYKSDKAGLSKYEYATTAAAAIAYLTLQQQDSVGLALFDETLGSVIKPSNNSHQWQVLLKELSGRTKGEKTSLDYVLRELADRLTHSTLVVLISDLFDDVDTILAGLKHLRYRRHGLIVWNIWDQAELSFPFNGPTMFDGFEASGRLLTEPRSLRTRYLEEVEGFQNRLRTGVINMNADFALFNTSESLDVTLSTYLSTRSARLRQRSSRVLGAG